MKLMIDNAGRIVLPKPMRDELRLEPGDALDIECSGEEIILRPFRGEGQLRKKRGVWVYRSCKPLPASTVESRVRRVRREREAQIQKPLRHAESA